MEGVQSLENACVCALVVSIGCGVEGKKNVLSALDLILGARVYGAGLGQGAAAAHEGGQVGGHPAPPEDDRAQEGQAGQVRGRLLPVSLHSEPDSVQHIRDLGDSTQQLCAHF